MHLHEELVLNGKTYLDGSIFCLRVIMKFYFQLILIYLLFCNSLCACTKEKKQTITQNCTSRNNRAFWRYLKPSLFVIVKNRKWGFIEQRGKIVIKPQFNYAHDFFEERAAFKASNGKWGFIDPNGKVAIQPKFDKVDSFYEQRSAVHIEGKWGFIDTNGNFIIEPHFEKASRFFEGRAAVSSAGKWRFIDLNGKFITQKEFNYVENYSEGLAAVIFKSQDQYEQGFIDLNGQLIFEAKNVNIEFERARFTNGLVPVYVDDNSSLIGEILFGEQPKKKWGFMDTRGKLTIPIKYDMVIPFSECLTTVWIQGKTGVINNSGKMVIEPKYDYIDSFFNGIALVKLNKKYGYIDKNGQILIEPKFHRAGDFSEGLAPVRIEEYSKFGYINTSGKMVIKPQFDEAYSFINGLAKVTLNNKSGYIDRTGKIVWLSAI
jgi:hypothetical protein